MMDAETSLRATPDANPWRWVARGLFALLVFGPLVALGAAVAQGVAARGVSTLAVMLPSARQLVLFANSLALALAVGASATLIGVLCASALWSWRSRAGRRLRWLLLVLVPVPPYVHALAWSLVGRGLDGWLALPGLPLDGWAASWWVHTMAFAPIGVAFALVGLEGVEPAMMAAARLLRPDGTSLVRVGLPLAGPSLAAGAGLLVVFSLADYSVPSLFHVNVYAVEIFAEYSASNDAAAAFLLAWPILVIAMAVVLASQSLVREAAMRRPRREQAWAVPPRLPAWLRWCQRAGLFLLALQILVPLVTLVSLTTTWHNFVAAAISARQEIAFTAWVGVLAAAVSVPLGLAVAPALGSATRSPRWWWALAMMPLAVPAPLVGIGLVTIWNHSAMPPVYGTWLMPVLAAIARFAPLAAIALLAQVRRLDPALVDAARIIEGSRARVWRRIVFPLVAPGLAVAAVIVLALTAGELGATLIVAPPGSATLTLRIYNFLHYGATETVGGLCLVMTALVAGTGALGALAVFTGSRIRWGGPA